MKKILPKIIVIIGPTASGKTAMSLSLAKKLSAKGGPASGWHGEIVNADSRQVYNGMDIGTAKPKWDRSVSLRGVKRRPACRQAGAITLLKQGDRHAPLRVARDDIFNFLVNNIPHHLFDIISPDEEFTLAHYKKTAIAVIKDILKRKKLPIVVGGTGLYIWALVDNLDIPEVAPDLVLRAELEKMPLTELIEKLKKVDPESAGRVDLKNPRRVIRALEVALSSGAFKPKKSPPIFDALQIGFNPPREELNRRINQRVEGQIKDGLVDEVKTLAKKYSWNLPAMSGIGYRQLRPYLEGRETLAEAIEAIKRDTRHYAKRQGTWFRRDKRMNWVNTEAEAEELIRSFLKISNF